MRKYLLRRAGYALGTLLGVSLTIFVVLRVIPGDPLVAILGVEGHAQMKPEDRELVQRLGRAQSAAAQLRQLEGDAGRIQTQLAAQEERARIQHQLGATTELVSMQRISDARQQAVRDLEASSPRPHAGRGPLPATEPREAG